MKTPTIKAASALLSSLRRRQVTIMQGVHLTEQVEEEVKAFVASLDEQSLRHYVQNDLMQEMITQHNQRPHRYQY